MHFDFSALPLTPENARAARNYLGLSQLAAAKESGLPDHKIKRFEAGNYLPDVAFLTALRTFFESRGYQFQDTPKPGAKARENGQVFPAGVVGETADNPGAPRANRPQQASVHHMRIALGDENAMGRILDVIDANEERAQELLKQPIEGGLFGGLSEQCQARHGEVVSLLAENGRLFAMLFGRQLGGTAHPEVVAGKQRPSTHADLLHKRQADASLWALDGSQDAQLRKKNRKPAGSLMTAIFG